MRTPVFSGSVALCAVFMIGAQLLTTKKVSADADVVALLTVKSESVEQSTTQSGKLENDVLKDAVETVIEIKEEILQEDNAEDIVHEVAIGESLEKIAEVYNVEDWTRLFDKNTDIQDPNILKVGQKIIIPEDDEELEKRELPVVVVSPQSRRSVQGATRTVQSAPTAAPRPASTSGNNYAYGYCTWYAKNQRPDLPNNLGNANTWYARASAQGYAVGYAPRVGAIAEALTGYMHVAYVTAVHGDGTITISEMNFSGWGVVSTRQVSASQFRYIY